MDGTLDLALLLEPCPRPSMQQRYIVGLLVAKPDGQCPGE